MSFNLQKTVGLNDDGSFAANLVQDQQQIAELLLMIWRVETESGTGESRAEIRG